MKLSRLAMLTCVTLVFICAPPFIGATRTSAGEPQTYNLQGTVGVGQTLIIGGAVKECFSSSIVACYRNITPLGGACHQDKITLLCLQPGIASFGGISEDSRSAKDEGETQFGGTIACTEGAIVINANRVGSTKQFTRAEIEDCVSNAPLSGDCVVSSDEMSYVAQCGGTTVRPFSFSITVTMDSDGSSFTRSVQCK